MDASSSGKSARRKKTKKGSAAKKSRKAPPPPTGPDAARYPTGEPVFFAADSYPEAAETLIFRPTTGILDMPENTFEFLRHELAAITERFYDELLLPSGEVILVVQLPTANRPVFQRFCQREIKVPGSSFCFAGRRVVYRVFWEELEGARTAEDGFFSSDSDFVLPDTSSDNDSAPERPTAARKAPTVAEHRKNHFTSDRNMLVDLRASVSSLGPLPANTTEVAAASQLPPSCPPQPDAAETSTRSALVDLSEQPMEDAASPAVPLAEQSSQTKMADPKEPQPRRAKFRYRTVDFSSLAVDVPQQSPALTVLFRPKDKQDSLEKAHPRLVTADLTKVANYTSLRDIRDGGLAVDFPADTDPEALLAISTLGGMPVTCSLPAGTNCCYAVLSGVNPILTTEEILEDVKTLPPTKVLAVKRLARPGQDSWSVKLTFEGTVVPESGVLYGRLRKLRNYVDKPLQCLRCARYGHTMRACRSAQKCWNCSLDHASKDCPNLTIPSCSNCGGPHPASDPNCPSRRMEVKICQVRATSKVPHKTARQAVTKAAKTYAQAARAAKPSREQQPQTPGFIPNVAHPRPPPPQGPADLQHLTALFRGLMTILSAAAASGDFASALGAIASLFQSQVPGADPGLFTV